MVGVGDVNIESLVRTLPGSFQCVIFGQHEDRRLAATLLDLVDAVGGPTVHQARRSGCGGMINRLSRIADDTLGRPSASGLVQGQAFPRAQIEIVGI